MTPPDASYIKELELDIRPARSTYIVLLVLGAPVLITSILAEIKTGRNTGVLLMVVGFLALLVYLVAATHIRVTSGYLYYHGPFSRRKVRLEDIREVVSVVGGKTYSERTFLPPIRLEVHAKAHRFKTFWINAKIFRLEDLALLRKLPELSRDPNRLG